ncbi:hypothetical protein TNCT_709971 [Trichonephila clavata]|uniref:Uncharacterized protein n=1 Tax=Trichonephila clavata TaxID=2740835 RepID=A0A8X6HNI8_TRICU|nr:hypothetical protein TNCT_709971 [Trichonephila clavata]
MLCRGPQEHAEVPQHDVAWIRLMSEVELELIDTMNPIGLSINQREIISYRDFGKSNNQDLRWIEHGTFSSSSELLMVLFINTICWVGKKSSDTADDWLQTFVLRNSCR